MSEEDRIKMIFVILLAVTRLHVIETASCGFIKGSKTLILLHRMNLLHQLSSL